MTLVVISLLAVLGAVTRPGATRRLAFNHEDIVDGRKLEQNIELRPPIR